MRLVKILACLALLLAPLSAQADEKPKAQAQIDAAKAAIEALAKKSDDNKLVAGDLEAARADLKMGEDAMAAGRGMFGLGDISPEVAQDVKHYTEMAELHLTLGQSRIDQARANGELKVMSDQVAKIKAKVKVFDDRKAELEKLRASLVKFDATLKQLGEVKEESARLAEKVGKLQAERKVLDAALEQLKAEVAKRDAAKGDQDKREATAREGSAAAVPAVTSLSPAAPEVAAAPKK